MRCECGADVEVPTLLHLKRLERATTPAPATETLAAWGPRQRLVLAGAILSVAGIALAASCFLTRPRIVDVAEFPPVAALRLWESLKAGIDLPPSPLEAALFDKIERHRRWTLAGLVVAALGVLAVTGSLLVRRRPVAKAAPASPAWRWSKRT
jgi:hypothetical protein